MFECFKNQFESFATCKFSLIPTEITEKKLSYDQIYKEAKDFYNKKKKVEKDFDDYFRVIIMNLLESYTFNYEPLNDILGISDKKERNKSISKFIENERKNFSQYANNNDLSYFMSHFLDVLNQNHQKDEIYNSFKNGDFDKFTTSRKTVLNVTIPDRIVENFIVFKKNISLIQNFDIKDESIFQVQNYNLFKSQKGIDLYNNKIGEINKIINETSDKKIVLKKLNKSILEISEPLFVIGMFKSFNEMKQNIISFYESTYKKLKNDISEIFSDENWNMYNLDNIYIHKNMLANLSIKIYNDKFSLKNKVIDYANENIRSKSKRESFVKSERFSVKFLEDITQQNIRCYLKFDLDIIDSDANNVCNQKDESNTNIIAFLKDLKNIENVFSIFNYRCKCKDKNNCKCISKFPKDLLFYSNYNAIRNYFKQFDSVYDMSSNFINKRNKNIPTYEYNFGFTGFGKGWHFSKINDNRTVILERNNIYYLAVPRINNFFNIDEIKTNVEDESNYYKICKISFWADASKMMPKCLFTLNSIKSHFDNSSEDFVYFDNKTMLKEFVVTKELMDIYCKDKKDLTDIERSKLIDAYIEYYAHCYKSTVENYNLSSLKNSNEYETLDEFFKHFDQLAYSNNFVYISESDIEKLQENDSLYLYKIHSKDFSVGHNKNSKEDKQTIIFKSFFTELNKKNNYSTRLSTCHVNYREPGIINNTVHKIGSLFVNRRDKNGNRIPEENYLEIYNFVNHKTDSISNESKKYLDNIVTRVVKQERCKDKRFTHCALTLHIGIYLNSNSKNVSFVKFNNSIEEYIEKNKGNMNILGIDRGERNLISFSVTSPKGEIIKSGCFDQQKGINYNAELQYRSNKRKDARKSFDIVPDIKMLKEGYISYVINEITKMIKEDNIGIIALEKLKDGMIHSRSHIEKQCYKKFENALIRKLSFMYCNKSESIFDTLQLAYYDDKNDISECNHNGIIYFVDPSYTSAIDPTTGFINNFKGIGKIDKAKDKSSFLRLMDFIKFKEGEFQFSFDYNNFDNCVEYENGKYTVSSNGERIVNVKTDYGHESKYIDLTDEIKKILDGNINYENGDNIKDEIVNNQAVSVKIFDVFKLIVKLRNSNDKVDYIISPVKNKDGVYFDSRKINDIDPDKLACSNIALKAWLNINHKLNKRSDYVNYLKG